MKKITPMLEELLVKDFGIIEEIDWRPGEGLNVITGETGAGKSLVVDAVEALLSGSAREEDIRHGAAGARVEGVFRLSPGHRQGRLGRLVEEKGLQGDGDVLLLSCEFRRKGRTTPRVNRVAVPLALLKEVGAELVDIHGQSDHLSLLDRSRHLDFLDAWAHTLGLRQESGNLVARLRQVEHEIETLLKMERDRAYRMELLRFQIDEIEKACLNKGEEEGLLREIAVLAAAEKLKSASDELYRMIYGDDGAASSVSVVDGLSRAVPLLKSMAEADPSLKGKAGYLEEALCGLEELAREMRQYRDNLNCDPRRLAELQERLELLRGLKRKYGGSVEAVLDYLAQAKAELGELSTAGGRRQELETEREALRKHLGTIGFELSQRREAAALGLAAAVRRELGDLGMGGVDFRVDISRQRSPEGIPFPDGSAYSFELTGVDGVVFMAATNPGEPPKPLDRIASTGEVSRFLLAIKGALATADTVPVLIFDEIDIGIGGRSGEIIGRKLWQLSHDHQVICVTHLPQIAAYADVHFNVSKRRVGERTISGIRPLQGEERCREMAVMIGGASFTASAMDTARELLEGAEKWKRSHRSRPAR